MENRRTIKKTTGLILLLVLSISLLPGCTGAIPTNIPTDDVERAILETLRALPTPTILTVTTEPTSTSPSATSVSTTVIPRTDAALPTIAFSLPAAARILFAPGATSATRRGTIGPGQTQNFVLDAQGGQPMLASVASPDQDATLAITVESGIPLLTASRGWTNWQGTLPASQDYYIQVIGGTREQEFSLVVSIPSRIQIAPGATATTVSGQTMDGTIVSYVVAAQGGQTMNIVLMPEPTLAALTVWGFSDGQPLMRAQMGSTAFNMQLPSTQDYIIDVVPQAGQEVNYTLRVEIE